MTFTFSWHHDLEEIPAQAWDALTGDHHSPFLDWHWLALLERSGCVQPETGWEPCHLAVHRGKELVAAAPLYLKGHSWGEFVFDQQWAEVSMRLGIPYYPKLVGMSPFTPATGYRFLVADSEDSFGVTALMLGEIDRFCKEKGVAGFHLLHVDPDWRDEMVAHGMSDWLHHALTWENHAYTTFDDYLGSFKSKQRKNIRRERRLVDEQGITFVPVRGEDAPEDLFTYMYYLYAVTCEKFYNWSRYLTLPFFEGLAQSMRHRILFVTAFEENRGNRTPIATSFFLHKGEHLYGRYWGSTQMADQLHFETCYYQPIEWAIKNGVRYFDAGSGNAGHKRRRGFPARPKYSLHRHYHPLMERVWHDNITRLNLSEQEQIDLINGED